MTKQQQQRRTAKIYAFPTSRRATSDSQRHIVKPTAQQAAAQFPAVEFGRGWYHDAAIEEEEACKPNHQQH